MRHSCLAAATVLLLGSVAAAPARAADPEACKTVRLADIGWADITATTALTALILHDLGYAPSVVAEPGVPETYAALKAKQIDVFLGNWMPSMAALRKPFLDDKSIEVIGPNLVGAKYTLAVPQYLYDKGLHDFADLEKFGKELGWKIYGIEPGNDGNQHVLDLIRQKRMGFGKFELVESSEQGMLEQLAKDYRHKRPIVFLGWDPHPMNRRYKIAYLTGGDDTFGPDFGRAEVYTNVRAGYAAECPNVTKLLENEKFGLAGEDAMMEAILDRKQEPSRAAAAWLRANRAEVAAWLDGVTTLDGQPGEPAVQGERGRKRPKPAPSPASAHGPAG